MQLTSRESECLEWAARGKSSWDIGTILNISENTVNFHLKNAMKKLGTNRRSVAAMRAIELKLIDRNLV
ncbi:MULTISPECIES: helix-turn-helix transcriptional regulator [unclassified Bradyrhizobium]|uniref:response regulator transcription factor n=1 Tax=unclassified Bradyrhizobium TaxID=2631580 RepID=UPI0029170218|nr:MULTISPECIES: helix-turn-helix transcriptional regulator [unclassified Bradyrhizobium]